MSYKIPSQRPKGLNNQSFPWINCLFKAFRDNQTLIRNFFLRPTQLPRLPASSPISVVCCTFFFLMLKKAVERSLTQNGWCQALKRVTSSHITCVQPQRAPPQFYLDVLRVAFRNLRIFLFRSDWSQLCCSSSGYQTAIIGRGEALDRAKRGKSNRNRPEKRLPSLWLPSNGVCFDSIVLVSRGCSPLSRSSRSSFCLPPGHPPSWWYFVFTRFPVFVWCTSGRSSRKKQHRRSSHIKLARLHHFLLFFIVLFLQLHCFLFLSHTQFPHNLHT